LIWQPVNKFEVVTHLSRSSSQYLNDGNSMKSDGYFLANVKLTSSLPVGNSGVIKLYAGINNLTDTHYASMVVVNAVGFGASQPRYFYPGLPMHGYAGVRFLF
jgi:iron complex outermembrane receptor protein